MLERDEFCDVHAIFELDGENPTKQLFLSRVDIGRKSNLLKIVQSPGVLDFSKEVDSMKGAIYVILRSFCLGKVEIEDQLLAACLVAMKKYNVMYVLRSLLFVIVISRFIVMCCIDILQSFLLLATPMERFVNDLGIN
jgi:hypothetical protein